MAAKAQTLIPEAHVVTYVVGRSGANPALVGWGLVGGFLAFALALYAATGAFLFPGALAFLGLQFVLSPPRGLAVCDRGLALTSRSFWDGKPTATLALFGFEMYRPVEASSGRTHLRLGTEDIWLTTKELKELHRGLTALREVQTAHAPAPPAATTGAVPAPAPTVPAPSPYREQPGVTGAPAYPTSSPYSYPAPDSGPASDPWAPDPYRSGPAAPYPSTPYPSTPPPSTPPPSAPYPASPYSSPPSPPPPPPPGFGTLPADGSAPPT
jgi:hypothetical protein